MMRFEWNWGLLAMTPVISLGCASVEKHADLRPPVVSEAIELIPSNPSDHAMPLVSPSNHSQVLSSGADVAIATVPTISLASSTTDQQSPIVVTAVEPPWVGVNSSIDLLSERQRSDSLSGIEDIEGLLGPLGQTEADQPETIPSSPESPLASSSPYLYSTEVPINLETALELAAGQNPQVAFANERIRESFAKLQSAQALWLPSLRTGANYHKHEGRIQDVAGRIIDTSRNSVYSGLGAQAVGAGSPIIPGVLMSFHLKDSLFQPRIAQQAVAASRHASRAVSNDTLLETALAYIDLLEATQMRAIVDETLANTEQLALLTQEFAKVGEGLQSDADRAATELAIRKFDAQKALEQSRVQSVRLARVLSQDPTLFLLPIEPVLAPIELVDISEDLSTLVAQGLSTRPELSEHQYLVGEAVERLRRERISPLVPSVLLGLSYGGNGGGLGSNFQNYGDRMDFDAIAFWEVRNLGYGEYAARCEAESRIRQARYRQVQELDRVASEIVEAKTLLDSKKSQIELAQSAIITARQSHRRNHERIRAGQGLPIEVQQSIVALDQAQRLYATTVAEYNRGQFRLHRALGFPAMAPSQ